MQLIVRAGAGYDTIDAVHCAKKGIYVANCPGKNAHAVAELALGLILNIDRRMAEGVQLLKEGQWNKPLFANCKGLKGRTLGLIGFGNIAQLVHQRAQAFEMNTLVHTRTQVPSLQKKLGFEYASLDELLARCDVVSLHVPSTADTKGFVNKEFLSKMREDAVLINTARGNVIVDDDLLAHLDSHPNFWYGADTYNNEPAAKGPFDSPLAKHPRVYGTHHIGASTKQAEAAIGDEAVRIIKKFAKSGQVDAENCVNKETDSSKLKKISVRHYDRVGVLAHVFLVMSQFNFNVQELENVVFKEREACVANIQFSGEGDMQKLVEEINKNENVLDVLV
mmetsp:Transcript_15066/g.10940  ORF Transcript_15066/g.10940 Transcript_15066/m.10940 type:complete len:336 (+) Transcript_15066:249-1256(+)